MKNKEGVFMKFYICRKCGSILTDFNHVCAGLTCCGEKVEELVAGTTDGAREKHVPAVKIDGQKVCVQVGEVEHPMMEKHYIQFIAIATKKGGQIAKLTPEDKPYAEFVLADGDEFEYALEYCNLHGLWQGK